jgi:hypothetical protein
MNFFVRNEATEFFTNVYANFAILGWGKKEVDETELSILFGILEKLKGDKNKKDENVVEKFDPKQAEEVLKKWQKMKR